MRESPGMDWFPALHCGRRLPLWDATAVALSSALVCESQQQRLQRLQAALALDPVFTLWGVCRAWTTQRRSLDSFASIANWLSVSLLDELNWRKDEATLAAQAEQASPARRERIIDGLAMRLAIAESDLDPFGVAVEPALVAQLHNTATWLSHGSKQLARDEADDVCPPWLAQVVCQQLPEVAVGADVRKAATQLADRLLSPTESAAELLRGVCQRLRRLNDLEADFTRQLHHEKLASLKEFSYGASHELNNPLFNISSRAQLLLKDEPHPERQQKLATIVSHALRASEMIKQVALFAHPPRPELSTTDVARVVQEVVKELQPFADERRSKLLVNAAQGSVTITADPNQLAVALRAICQNALIAFERAATAGTVTVTVAEAGDGVQIAVADDGPGLDERSRRHLFDPFFSGYESGRGLGFGLSKCWQIVQAHHGAIDVNSEPGSGTTFTICLPRMPVTDGLPSRQS